MSPHDVPLPGPADADARELPSTQRPSATPPEEPVSPDGTRVQVLPAATEPAAAPARRGPVRTTFHAKGGLGEVWRADDHDLGREVAYKVIQEKQDGPGSRDRFLREARLTGGLEHPNIVPVYGRGADEQGRPYYAMRFIEGTSLKDAIAELHKAPPRERDGLLRALLRRFVDVCNAMDYAHSEKKVVHRDLKPANVMLGKYGETLVVDWGMAWRLEGDEGSPAVGGTPGYMSPQQEKGERPCPGDDVYSLGATLYGVLAGQGPKEGRRPREVCRWAPKALDAACLKALAKSAEERYTSARALKDDVQRWLDDEPVSAYREPLAQRAARFARRHQKAVTGVGVLLVTLLGAGTVSAVSISRARDRAVFRFDQARQAVDDYLLRITDDERLKGEALRPLRQQLLGDGLRYYEGFLEDREGDAGLKRKNAVAHLRVAFIRQEMGDAARAEEAYQTAFALFGELEDSRENQMELALGHLRRGDMNANRPATRAEAKGSYQQALDLLAPLAGGDDIEAKRLLARVYRSLTAWHKVDRGEETMRFCQKALELRKEVAGRAPADEQAKRELAGSYMDLGILRNEGRDLKGALEAYGESRKVWESMGKGGPDARAAQAAEARILHDIAIIHHHANRMAEAEKARRQAMQMREVLLYGQSLEAVVDLAQTYNDLAVQLVKEKGPRQAEGFRLFELAREHREKLASVHGTNMRLLRELSQTYNNLGKAGVDLKRFDLAAAALKRAGEVLDRVPADRRDAPEVLEEWGLTHHNRGYLHLTRKEHADAKKAFGEARAVRERLVREQGHRPEVRDNLLQTCVMLGNTAIATGDKEALTHYRRAVELAEQLLKEAPGEVNSYSKLAITLYSLGNAQYRLTDQLDAAAASLQRAVEVQTKAVQKAPANKQLILNLDFYNRLLGEVRTKREQID